MPPPKPRRRGGRVPRGHLDVNDRIGHLPLLPFSLVFSQVATFLPSLPVFHAFSPFSLTRCVSRGQWMAIVSTAFPNLSRPQANVLAYWSYGMVVAKACGIVLVG